MEATTTKGGVRRNAGRKPSLVKKKPVAVYLPETLINELGIKEIRLKIYKHFENDIK